MAKLFIVGFPFETDEIALTNLFSPYGEIGWVNIIIDKETGKSLGYGFVMFPEEDAANKAIESMDGKTIDGRKISVKKAVNSQKSKQKISVPKERVQNALPEKQTTAVFTASGRKKRPRISK